MIHPRRLKGTPANIARYYTVGDYYTKGSDEHSQWSGTIAAELGLEGKEVDPELFRQLLAGQIGDRQLGRYRANGEIQHHTGWDFAINAPKSVSLMALVTGDQRIIDAHEKAVTTALRYIEEHAALRRRDNGEIVEETTGRLIIARFTEYVSRELDPHLHTHAVILNITNREDGSPMVSLETRAMYAEQMVAGQVYRNDLSHRLREIGWEIEFNPRSGLFEIIGVPKDYIKENSQRAEQISAHAKEHGLTGQAARRISFYETRGPKAKATLDDLRTIWTERARPYEQDLSKLLAEVDARGERKIEIDPKTAGRASLFGLRQAETREAVNNIGRMYQLALASHVGEVRLADIRPLINEHEEKRKLLATHKQTGDQILTRGRTSRRSARSELALSQHLALGVDDARPIASADRLLAVLEGAGLKPEQEQALTHVALSRDRITGIQGVGGSGKSTLIKTLDQAAEPGTIALALAPTSSATATAGDMGGVESRTVASLLASGGHTITDRHVLVVDEAGQLGTRQALRILELSRATGARVILLGDDEQTGAIEQGKPFWLLQKFGLTIAYMTESTRQRTEAMQQTVAYARAGEYAKSLAKLDKVVSGEGAEALAEGLVKEWTRLKPENRSNTNILVLENATRLIVNAKIRETLKEEGALAAEDARLSVLIPSGMTDEEKRYARFYSGGQVVTFARDIVGVGIARNTEYRVQGIGRDANGRQVVRLVGENGRTIHWDPRLGKAQHISVFNREERDLAEGDRIQWRLVNKDLDIKNAERGTIEKLDGHIATIRWDRGNGPVQEVDLSRHKTWDHGYAETVYSSQSKTYDRVYVLAPVNSGLVNGKNYYTAVTRARYGVKLWTEDSERLIEKLTSRSGQKTSSLEGLGRLDRDTRRAFADRHADRLDRARQEQERVRQERRDRALERQLRQGRGPRGLGEHVAESALRIANVLDWFLQSMRDRDALRDPLRSRDADSSSAERQAPAPVPSQQQEPSRGPER